MVSRSQRNKKNRRNKNKYKYILLIFAVVILITCFALFYTKDKTLTVGKFKTFTINYNALSENDTLDKHDISVVDSSNIKQEISLKWDYNRSSIVIQPPSSGYKPGESYTLNINDNLKFSISGIDDNKKKLEFKVRDEEVSKRSIVFKDKNLEQAIRSKINKEQGDLIGSDLDNITELVATFMDIRDLTGIENLRNLHTLALDGNKIKDISVLQNLTELEYAGLSNNEISDITSIKKLTNLKFLSLLGNHVEDYTVIDEITRNLQWKDYQ